jgi:hypothetical protein
LNGDALYTANLGFLHAKPEEADRTVVCLKGFLLPKLPIRPSKWLTVRLLDGRLA